MKTITHTELIIRLVFILCIVVGGIITSVVENKESKSDIKNKEMVVMHHTTNS